MNCDEESAHEHLDGWVIFGLLSWFHPFQPLDNRLDVAADFTLEGGGSPVVHSGVDGVSTSQNGFRVGSLWREKMINDQYLLFFYVEITVTLFHLEECGHQHHPMGLETHLSWAVWLQHHILPVALIHTHIPHLKLLLYSKKNTPARDNNPFFLSVNAISSERNA